MSFITHFVIICAFIIFTARKTRADKTWVDPNKTSQNTSTVGGLHCLHQSSRF